MKYLVDTDIASYFLRGKYNLLNIFIQKGISDIRISAVSVAELEVLVHKNPASKINFSSSPYFPLRSSAYSRVGVSSGSKPKFWKIGFIILSSSIAESPVIGGLASIDVVKVLQLEIDVALVPVPQQRLHGVVA